MVNRIIAVTQSKSVATSVAVHYECFFLLLQNYSFDVSFTASELCSKAMGLSEILGTVACRSLIHKNAMRYFRLKCSCTGISHLTTSIRNNPGEMMTS